MVRRQNIRRRKKPDRLTNPEDVGIVSRMATHNALAALDETATRYEQKWGFDRLPKLVDAEMASRFGAAQAKLDAAIDADDADEIARRAAVLQRGWRALDEAATSAGHKPGDWEAWLWRDREGRPCALARHTGGLGVLLEDTPGIRVFTLSEAENALWHLSECSALKAIKDEFPAAEVIEIRDRDFSFKRGDDLPF